jgi:ABC-2 type transport system permease protein
LSFAANYEIKDLKMCVVDHDLSPISRQLVSKFKGNNHFVLQESSFSMQQAMEGMATDKTDLILEIPANFDRDLTREGHASIAMSVNAINAQKAGLGGAYAEQIIRDFDPVASPPGGGNGVEVSYSNWFNPRLDYKTFMVPGILGEVIALVICFLTAMNIVREREIGTIEQLNVTPIRKWQFIMGKFIPFWLISLLIMMLGLAVGKLVFDIPMLGSLWLVFGYTAAFMPCMLGLGFLISNFADTQQQAMFTAWFFLIIFILMCGLFTPVESMPDWAQVANKANPIAYFVQFMRMVLLKGAGFAEIRHNLWTVLAYATTVNGLAVWTYRKRT